MASGDQPANPTATDQQIFTVEELAIFDKALRLARGKDRAEKCRHILQIMSELREMRTPDEREGLIDELARQLSALCAQLEACGMITPPGVTAALARATAHQEARRHA